MLLYIGEENIREEVFFFFCKYSYFRNTHKLICSLVCQLCELSGNNKTMTAFSSSFSNWLNIKQFLKRETSTPHSVDIKAAHAELCPCSLLQSLL